MIKKHLYTGLLLSMIATQSVFAFEPREIISYFNGPTVSSITENSVAISLSSAVLKGISDEEKAGLYFEYIEPGMMCITIYPTPEACLPKKTELGKTEVTFTNLKQILHILLLTKKITLFVVLQHHVLQMDLKVCQ